MTVEHAGGERPVGHFPGTRFPGDPYSGDQTPDLPTTAGRVAFVGAGPGAADLITLRGARRIAQADLVIWSASLVPAEAVQEHVRGGAELVDSSRLGNEELLELYRRAERERLSVARVHSGDPTMWGSVQEQYDACVRMRLDVEMVPGVTGFSAAAASVGKELTSVDADQPVMVSRMDGGKVAMPERASIAEFAQRGATMALSVSAARTGRLVEELRAGGYHDDVPVVVAHKPSAPDELLVRTTLGELQATVKHHKLWRNTLFLVGMALAETRGARRSFATFRHVDGSASGGVLEGTPRWVSSTRAGDERAGRPASGGARERRGSPAVGEAVLAAHADAEVAEAVPDPRVQDVRKPGQPDSAVAWWAVRDWQRTARGAARVAAARASSRAGVADSGQPELFVTDGCDTTTAASGGGAAPEDAAESVGVGQDEVDGSAAPESLAPESLAPEPPLDDPPAPGPSQSVPESQSTATASAKEDSGAPLDEAGAGRSKASGRSKENGPSAASKSGSKPRTKATSTGKGRGSGASSASKTRSTTPPKSGTAKSSTSPPKPPKGASDSPDSGE